MHLYITYEHVLAAEWFTVICMARETWSSRNV